MKTLALAFSLLAIVALSGCAGSNDTSASMSDQAISTDQTEVKKACYKALEKTKPDMSTWKPEQIMAYTAVEKLGEANKLLAKVSTDPCADAGGTNVYDAKIVQIKEGTKRQKNQMDFGLGIATRTLYGFFAYEANDAYKAWVNKDDDDTELGGFAEDVKLGADTNPVITAE